VDELLAGLASMGFEFEECHQAIQAGNTNLQSAVEWYKIYGRLFILISAHGSPNSNSNYRAIN